MTTVRWRDIRAEYHLFYIIYGIKSIKKCHWNRTKVQKLRQNTVHVHNCQFERLKRNKSFAKMKRKEKNTILILTWSHDTICWRMKAYENFESFAGLIRKIQWHKHKSASEYCALSSAFMCIVLNVKTFRIYYLKRKRQFLLSSDSTHRSSMYLVLYNGALSEFNHKMLHRTNSNTHEHIYIYINALF